MKLNEGDDHPGHDTVGAVAFDRFGNVACATSTGGIAAKRPGRVGDSPITGQFAGYNYLDPSGLNCMNMIEAVHGISDGRDTAVICMSLIGLCFFH